MKVLRTRLSILSVVASGFFGVFLAASPPHRVHHFFEQPLRGEITAGEHHDHAKADHPHGGESDHHHDRGHQPERDAGAKPDCALQLAAQHVNLSLSPLVTVQIAAQASTDCCPTVFAPRTSHYRSPYSPRAPPSVS
jgi:hypothetical protein